MKNVIALAVLCLFIIPNLFAQGVIPSLAVQTTFQELHPETERPFWELREGAVVALFKEEGQLVKAFFEHNGKWRETRSRTPLTLLPEAVQYFVRAHFEHADINYLGVVTTPLQKPLYRIESEVHDAVLIKLLNAEGQLVQQDRIGFDTGQQIQVVGIE